MQIVDREKTLKLLHDSFGQAINRPGRKGLSSHKVLQILGKETAYSSASIYAPKIEQLFSKYEIPFAFKGICGWHPKEEQQVFDFESQKETTQNPKHEDNTEKQPTLFGKTKEEVVAFFDNATSTKRGVTSAEVCLWANVELSQVARNMISNFLVDNEIPYECKRRIGFAKIGLGVSRAVKKEKLNVDSVVKEMEQSVHSNSSTSQFSSDERINLICELLRQHGNLVLAAIEKIWTPR